MSQLKIVIIDYGVGNTFSVFNSIKFLGYDKIKISDDECIINEAEVLILPGVGAFDAAIRNFKERKLDLILNEQVLIKKKPILGICLGMQLLAASSEENGINAGMNWIPGEVKRLKLSKNFPVPHVGWNNINITKTAPVFTKNSSGNSFYFDHSYYFDCEEQYVSAFCNYEIKIAVAVQKENVFGVQFHPEKSQTNGLKLFRGFLNSV